MESEAVSGPQSPVPGSLPEAEAVATGWILTFACRCLCRHFCEGSRRDFERNRDLALAVIKGLPGVEAGQAKTARLCRLLACVAEGKSPESHFEDDQRISPLEKALSVWISLQKMERKQDKLHEDIKSLIQIQAVAVYMEKGYFKEATEVLERLFPESCSDEPLRMKLAAVIKRKDPYHQFLQHFSFSLLTKKIKSYINTFLNEESNNFLMEEAEKEVEARRSGGITVCRHYDGVNEANKENDLESTQRSDKQAYFLPTQTLGVPGLVRVTQQTRNKRSALQSKTDMQDIENGQQGDQSSLSGETRKRQRWSWEEDKKLREGVKKFGEGNWIQILKHYDLAHRTNVMLKDRWRTLVRLGMA
ncbi:telomeric repeat-binding factor 1 [Tiliqua scincoides]|uniref:telomeric repeat-binding factor 1 n=1 Tax=Tiliqua scincoides TaxID=71010 RepID=UPI003463346B